MKHGARWRLPTAAAWAASLTRSRATRCLHAAWPFAVLSTYPFVVLPFDLLIIIKRRDQDLAQSGVHVRPHAGPGDPVQDHAIHRRHQHRGSAQARSGAARPDNSPTALSCNCARWCATATPSAGSPATSRNNAYRARVNVAEGPAACPTYSTSAWASSDVLVGGGARHAQVGEIVLDQPAQRSVEQGLAGPEVVGGGARRESCLGVHGAVRERPHARSRPITVSAASSAMVRRSMLALQP